MKVPSWLDRAAYPFTSHTLKLPAGELHYVDEGRGTPVLLVHGNPTWSFLYREVIRALRVTHRCVAPDHLGFGLSEKPERWSYTPAGHAENLTRLIEALGLRDITLVVHDWGGPIGLRYATRRWHNVRALVVLNSWMWPLNRDPYYWGLGTLARSPLGRWLYLRHNLFVRRVMPLWFGGRRPLTRAVHAHYLRPAADRRARYAIWRLSAAVLGSTPWLAELWAARATLRAIPMQLVWGMKDLAFRRKELRRWRRAFPAARVCFLQEVGHFVPEEAPTSIVESVRRV